MMRNRTISFLQDQRAVDFFANGLVRVTLDKTGVLEVNLFSKRILKITGIPQIALVDNEKDQEHLTIYIPQRVDS